MRLLRTIKGFTLTELCIIMAIVAIVGTMIVSTVLFFEKQNSDIKNQSTFVSDISDLQKSVDGWLKKYDNDDYENISILSTKNGLTTKKLNDSHLITLKYENGVLKENGTAISQNHKSISSLIFAFTEENPQIIKVTVKAKKGNTTKDEILLFSLFSGSTRERSVTGRGQ